MQKGTTSTKGSNIDQQLFIGILRKQRLLENAEIVMNVERGGVENTTWNSCGLAVKTSRFKGYVLCGNFFSFLHFLTYIIELPKRLGSSFSKTRTLYAFFLIVFFANSNFMN